MGKSTSGPASAHKELAYGKAPEATTEDMGNKARAHAVHVTFEMHASQISPPLALPIMHTACGMPHGHVHVPACMQPHQILPRVLSHLPHVRA